MHSVLFFFILAAATPAAVPPTIQQEIIVTASASPEELGETPAAASVITREEIEKREARDVADVLREVPGVTVARTGSSGKETSVFLRGGSSKQALVLWNGVEMNNAYHSAYNFGQLSTAGVERVEIVRGPFSALYGSDAVSGVVNVLTTPTRDDAGVDLEAGEHGLMNAAAHGALARDRWSAHATVERREDDGFAPNDDYRSSSVLGGATFAPRANASIGLLARYSSYDLGIPRNVNAFGTAFVPTPNRREDGWESQIAIPIHLDAGRMNYTVRLTENHRKDDYADPDGAFGPESSHTDAVSRAANASVRAKTAIGTITVGGEYLNAEVDHTDSFGLDVDARDRDSRSLFVEDRVSIAAGSGASFEIAAGLRNDDYDTFGSQLSPRVAAAWVRNGHKIRAAYGQGFRAPAIGELYSPFFGFPDLQPERSRSVEVGYDHFFPNGGEVTASLFDSDYTDLIFFDLVAGHYANINTASSRGVELGASHRFGALSASLSYTYLDTEDSSTGAELLRRPRHSGSLAIGYDFAPFTAELVVQHTGPRLDVTDLAPYGNVTNEARTIADLTLRWVAGAFVPYVRVENLTDTRYEEVFGYPSAPRRISAGVRYSIR
jgi:vitamin B12 transporter